MATLNSKEDYAEIVRKSPIVAVDLILEDAQGKVLLGRRLNRPAKNWYFSFGGAVLKNESVSSALERISKNETGLEIDSDSARFVAFFELFYDDNFAGAGGFGTHYVVLSFCYKVDTSNLSLNTADAMDGYSNQHSDTICQPPWELVLRSDVHADCKGYLKKAYDFP